MRKAIVVGFVALVVAATPVVADEGTYDDVDTVPGAVRVVVIKAGGEYSVSKVSGGGAPESACDWSLVFVDEEMDGPWQEEYGPKPHPDARPALLLCDGSIADWLWITPNDIVDLDAAAGTEAQRYIEDVLVPAVRIGVNPAARGLVGLESWFWIDGFDGQVTAPPITAFGLTIEVRMSSGTVSWDFGDGTVEPGDLGRPYPEQSTVRHAHQHDGTFAIGATIDLVPEFRVDGGAWITLPNLSATATATHDVEERQAVVSQT